MARLAIAAAVLTLLSAGQSAHAADPPASWDGLSHVASKKLDAVYLLPDADFRPYTKVLIDPTEVAFRKNWVRDYNSEALELSAHISDAEAQKMLAKVRTGFEDIFRKAYADAGYQVVTEPGADVLQIRTAVINLSVDAPDRTTSARSYNLAPQAGEATVVIEARDSQTGALLGRAVDERIAGDGPAYLRDSTSNRADFGRLFGAWAKTSVAGLAELKAMSPVSAAQTAGK